MSAQSSICHFKTPTNLTPVDRYPPNAPEPVSMADYDKPISHTFSGHTSNLNLVSLFVYIKPEAEQELSRITTPGSAGETFIYPPRSSLPAFPRPSAEEDEDEPISRIEAQLEMGDSPRKPEKRRRRGASSRPSTAPTMGSCEVFPTHGSAGLSGSSSAAVPAFGRPRKTGFNTSTSTSALALARSSSTRNPLYPTEDQDPILSSSLGLGQSPLELERGVHLIRPCPGRTTRSEEVGDWQGMKMELDLEALRRLDLDLTPQVFPGRALLRNVDVDVDVEEEVLKDDPAPELELDHSSLRSSSMGSNSNSMPPTPANELGGPYFVGAGAIVGHAQVTGRGGKVWA